MCTSNTANASLVHPIRSYRTRGALSPSCTILQAACACIASLGTFDPVTIGVGHKKAVLTDAMVGYANPAKELLREAQDVFGEDGEVASVVSIGAGKGNFRVAFKDGREEGISEGMKRGVVICEQVHEDLQGRLQETNIYYRFNVEQETGIDPEVILAHVSTYLREKAISTRVDSAVKSIKYRLTGVKLKNISECGFPLSSVLTVCRLGDDNRDCTQATAISSRQFHRSSRRFGGDGSDSPRSSANEFQEVGDKRFIWTGRRRQDTDGTEVCVGFWREVRLVLHMSIEF